MSLPVSDVGPRSNAPQRKLRLHAAAPAFTIRTRRTGHTMKFGWRVICGAGVLLAALGAAAADARDEDGFDMSASNLLVVLRESPGANKLDEGLAPFGKISARAADGREFEFEASWFQYLGDMHLRLVFDGRRQVQSAMPDDLARLRLSPEQA